MAFSVETLARVRALTRQADAALVVADDGSDDETPTMLRDLQVPVITGINMGIAWNKNRALFLLSHMLGCETVILLEDDTQPDRPGWEAAWIAAARRWGHVNVAGDWLSEHFLSVLFCNGGKRCSGTRTIVVEPLLARGRLRSHAR